MPHTYRNLIFTNHARHRQLQRGVADDAIYETLMGDEVTLATDTKQKYTKVVRGRRIQVIAQHQPAKNNWLIISVWVRGEEDQLSWEEQLLLLPLRCANWLWQNLFKK